MRHYGLYGREQELSVLENQIRRLGEGRGGALVIAGGPGSGKSALIDAAARIALTMDGQATVLRTAGVRSEATIEFAGLHRLLQPVLDLAGDLPPSRQRPLDLAFGVADCPDADRLGAGLATLDLVAKAAAGHPLVLVIDDAQWLDESSRVTLGLAARRLDRLPVLMLAAGNLNPFGDAAVAELELTGLDNNNARALLNERWPGLSAYVREQVLAVATGNPLALTELPASPAVARNHAPLPRPIELTTRLEQAFTAQAAGLPAATGWILLVLAAEEKAAPREVIRAAAKASGTDIKMGALWPAVRAGLADVGRTRLTFSHQLHRLAIYQAAGPERRLAAHAAVADVLGDRDDRRVWHLAAATLGPDETIAAELDRAASRAERRGAVALAAAAMERAAELGDGGRRLRPLRVWAEWAAEAKIGALIATADRMRADGHPLLAAESLHAAALRCWWGTPDRQTRAAVCAAAERTGLPLNEPAVLAVLACADPIRRGAEVTRVIAELEPDAADPAGMYLIGSAAGAVWSYDLASGFLDVAVGGLRALGNRALLTQALVAQAWTGVHLADGPLALSAANEAGRLARETGQRRWAIGAQFARAAVTAQGGDLDAAEALCGAAESMLPPGHDPMLALSHYVRGHGAVASQQYERGAESLARIRDRADPARHPFIGTWGLADLTEALVQVSDLTAARDSLAELEELARVTSGSLLRAQASYARPLVAGADGSVFRQAIEHDLAGSPCYRGRMQLRYGRWLRRRRQVAESRGPLRAARDSFDALGLVGLAEHARQELRAAGETSRRREPEAWDQLTARELQIARLASEGMSNRDIGRELCISHRTVGYHLQRIFPKLAITSRSQLHASLAYRAGRPLG